MLINVKDKVDYKNFITILNLLEESNSLELTGRDKGIIDNVDIENVTLRKYCNTFHASNFTPNNKFKLTDVLLDGKYNIIELVDLPKGQYIFNTKNSFEEDSNSDIQNEKVQISRDKIDKILRTIERSDDTLLVKNKSHDKLFISNNELDDSVKDSKVYYFKNISGISKVPEIIINYDHNNLILIIDSTISKIIINNNSKLRISPKKILKKKILDEMKDEQEYLLEMEDEIVNEVDIEKELNIENTKKNIEGFANSKTCTSSGEIIIIAIIIYAFFKLMTKRQTIKIFN